MPPIALTPAPRLAAPTAVRPATIKPAPAPRQNQVLQTGRAPAQLSLFLRPNGAR
jgi:hypothetical protein